MQLTLSSIASRIHIHEDDIDVSTDAGSSVNGSKVVPVPPPDVPEPWEHALMLKPRSKAEGYVRDRAARKELQQRQVLVLGATVTCAGFVLFFVLFTTQTVVYPLIVAGCIVQFGLCLTLVCDSDINQAFRLRPWLIRGCAGAFAVAQLAGLLRALASGTYDGAAALAYSWTGSYPVLAYTICHAPQMAAQRPERPLPSEVVGLWLLGASATYLGQVALILGGVIGIPEGISRDALAMPSAVCVPIVVFWLWLLTPRTRLVHRRRGSCLGWWARSAAGMGPTTRCMASVGGAILFSMSRTQARSLFPESPAPGWHRSRALVAEAVVWHLLAVLPMLLAWRWRTALFGALAKLFERKHRLQDGVFIASLLAGEPLRVGDGYWLREKPAPPSTRGGTDVAFLWEEEPRWHRGKVSSIEVDFFTVDLPLGLALPATLERRTTILGAVNMPADELFRLASSSLYQMPASELTLALLDSEHVGDIGSLVSNSLRRTRCRPGETDWYVLHSWHDDRAMRLTTLARCTAQFEELHGHEPTLWIDSVCVDAVYKKESLICLPIYMQACRGVLVLWGDSFCERLWCVWELYTAFAFSGSTIALTVAMLESPDNGGQSSELRTRALASREALAAFELSRAHCANPNEEKQLRDAIGAAPGGAGAFEATIRGLASQLQEGSTAGMRCW